MERRELTIDQALVDRLYEAELAALANRRQLGRAPGPMATGTDPWLEAGLTEYAGPEPILTSEERARARESALRQARSVAALEQGGPGDIYDIWAPRHHAGPGWAWMPGGEVRPLDEAAEAWALRTSAPLRPLELGGRRVAGYSLATTARWVAGEWTLAEPIRLQFYSARDRAVVCDRIALETRGSFAAMLEALHWAAERTNWAPVLPRAPADTEAAALGVAVRDEGRECQLETSTGEPGLPVGPYQYRWLRARARVTTTAERVSLASRWHGEALELYWHDAPESPVARVPWACEGVWHEVLGAFRRAAEAARLPGGGTP